MVAAVSEAAIGCPWRRHANLLVYYAPRVAEFCDELKALGIDEIYRLPANDADTVFAALKGAEAPAETPERRAFAG